jgi:uncharacterized membrane protein YhhN
VTGTAGALLAAAACLAVLDWAAVARGRKPLEYVAKPATLAALVAVAVVVQPTSPTQRTWFVIALVLSLAGDVFLMLPSDRFVPGLIAFLLAHVAYVGGFWGLLQEVWVVPAARAVVLAAAAPLLVRLVRGARASGQSALVGPVLAYAVVISLMAATAIGTGRPFAIAGALLFLASDMMIGWRKLVRGFRGDGLFIIVTYHLAQGLLVLSLVA